MYLLLARLQQLQNETAGSMREVDAADSDAESSVADETEHGCSDDEESIETMNQTCQLSFLVQPFNAK